MKGPINIRRCHMCGSINERHPEKISRCEDCGKSLAPFYYYDDRFTPVMSDEALRPPLLEGEYTPIQGLTAIWEG